MQRTLLIGQNTDPAFNRANRQPLVVSHRGGRQEYDDNSATGFELSLAHGLRGFETDLRITKDDEIVVMHNGTLDATTNGSGIVEEMTRGEISRFRLKTSGDPIPFLDDLLALFRGRDDISVEFELKCEKLGSEARLLAYCRKVRDLVAAAMPEGSYVFTSFQRDALRAMRAVDARVRLGLIMFGLVQDDLDFAASVGAVRVAPRIGDTSEAMARKAAAAGLEMTLWMVEDVADYERAAAWGATAVTSDHPVYLFDALQTPKQVVTIVGAGMMGSALAFPARENGHEVRLVGTHLDREIIDVCRATGRHPKFKRDFPWGVKFHPIEDLDEALRGADVVIGGVSSFGVEWFHEHVLPAVPEATPVLTVTKGLVDAPDGSLVTYPEHWERKLAERGLKRRISAIGGPCTSYELVAHDQTEVYFCGREPDVLRMLRDALSTPYYHISLSTDVRGVESAVALKNGYALAIAMTIGINQKERGKDSEPHFNSQAAAFQQGLKEMRQLIRICGGGDDKILLGAGDLYVTVYGGRTRLVGMLLGRGLSIERAMDELQGVTLESLVVATRVARAVKALAARGQLDLKDFPLLMAVDAVINAGRSAHLPWDAFPAENFEARPESQFEPRMNTNGHKWDSESGSGLRHGL